MVYFYLNFHQEKYKKFIYLNFLTDLVYNYYYIDVDAFNRPQVYFSNLDFQMNMCFNFVSLISGYQL